MWPTRPARAAPAFKHQIGETLERLDIIPAQFK